MDFAFLPAGHSRLWSPEARRAPQLIWPKQNHCPCLKRPHSQFFLLLNRAGCWAVWQLGNVRQSSDSSVWAKRSQALWKTVTIADQAWLQSIDPSQSLGSLSSLEYKYAIQKVCFPHQKIDRFCFILLELENQVSEAQNSFRQVLSQVRLKLTLVCAHKYCWPYLFS